MAAPDEARPPLKLFRVPHAVSVKVRTSKLFGRTIRSLAGGSKMIITSKKMNLDDGPARQSSRRRRQNFIVDFPSLKNGSSRNPGKDRNKNADLIDDVRASKHI
jgi:hypothetical protein